MSSGDHIYSPEHAISGLPIPPHQRVKLFSPDEWEDFIEEWALTLEDVYFRVDNRGGSGDYGVDIACSLSESGTQGDWDSFQCKRLNDPLTPSDIWVEIGKIIYYCFQGEFRIPLKHYFVCNRGVGSKLLKYLDNPENFKEYLKVNWVRYCQDAITLSKSIYLDGEFAEYLDNFNFSIFSYKSVLDLIDQHKKHPHHVIRFGGGLPERNIPESPPVLVNYKIESIYIKQLLLAYSDKLGNYLTEISELNNHVELEKHFLGERKAFYFAESLKSYARDSTPEGTFEQLQQQIYHGISQEFHVNHGNGFETMIAVLKQAVILPLSSSLLLSIIDILDRKGICHQLVNDGEIRWVKEKG